MARNSYANVVIGTSGVRNNTVVPTEEEADDSSGGIMENEEVPITSNLHPLYLHNIDHHGLILISKKLTGTENFGPWKRSISIALTAKNKIGIVDGSYARPESDSPLRNQWERVNDMVISWILNTVSDEISNGMDFVNSAKGVWEELHEQFSSIDGHRVYQVLKDLHALEQSDKYVEIYYHKMKNLWDEYGALEPTGICRCDVHCESHKLQEERDQRRKLLQFLMGLNESFATARGQILMMNPLLTVSQAYYLIKQEEKQRQTSTMATAFNVNSKSSSFQGSHNSSYNNEGSSVVSKKSYMKCSYCHKEDERTN